MQGGKCCPVTWVAHVLLLIGGLNWGLVGIWEYNLVNVLFGSWPTVETVVYALVGISAVWMLVKMVTGYSCKR